MSLLGEAQAGLSYLRRYLGTLLAAGVRAADLGSICCTLAFLMFSVLRMVSRKTRPIPLGSLVRVSSCRLHNIESSKYY